MELSACVTEIKLRIAGDEEERKIPSVIMKKEKKSEKISECMRERL